jgi:hypothetical protein
MLIDCKQRGVTGNEVLQATRCCRQRGVAGNEVLQATRCCKQRDIAGNEMLDVADNEMLKKSICSSTKINLK